MFDNKTNHGLDTSLFEYCALSIIGYRSDLGRVLHHHGEGDGLQAGVGPRGGLVGRRTLIHQEPVVELSLLLLLGSPLLEVAQGDREGLLLLLGVVVVVGADGVLPDVQGVLEEVDAVYWRSGSADVCDL